MAPTDPALPLELAWGCTLAWVALGVLQLFTGARSLYYAASALVGLALAGIALAALGKPAQAMIVPLGLPDLPLHLRLDALSVVFLTVQGLAACGISLHAAGYFRSLDPATARTVGLWYNLFLAGMALVVLTDDAYAFMVAWELMALASYFLVTTDHAVEEIRHAGFLYLLMAHVGAVALLLAFGVIQGGQGAYTFDVMRAATPSPFWAAVAFLLAVFGFGAKAGLVPLHVWLPEAHPAAPSPVSALMSGVMLKTAIYGLLRVTLDLLPSQPAWWGTLLILLGLVSTLYGVIFAAVQSDIKRLLAWSSIENIGIIVTGIGLALVFRAESKAGIAALALTAALYHVLNHALMKGLLFLGTGSVLHATGTRLMGGLGGLIRAMPWTATLMLIGVFAIAGLPPLNGFVSEWLLLQAFLFTPGLAQPYLNMIIPVAAAAVALAAALAAYVMVKLYGVTFLGQPRSAELAHAHEAGWPERLGMLWLAAGCVVLGLVPMAALMLVAPASQLLLGAALPVQSGLLLAPLGAERASFAPGVLLAVLLFMLLATLLWVRLAYHSRVRHAAAWDCGYPEQDGRMQDTAEGFGQPIRHVFDAFMKVEREMPDAFDPKPRYRGATRDRLWILLYTPLARLVAWLAEQAARAQHGRIQWYLFYSFATLTFLLFFVSR
ncbi:hydrogenase 4 subunit B [Thiobacter aerophilum]|uniref:Hydrogenase 4 subunit B n=1 Tax=Thiobacter aerophilum TaxID=3121275 RepID=A0ABV0EBR6_9BURK